MSKELDYELKKYIFRQEVALCILKESNLIR